MGVGFLPKVSGSQGIVGATNTEMLVSSQPLQNMPGARDIRIIAESKDDYSDTFTPFETVVSSDSYHQLGLVQGKMMPITNYVPNVTVAGRKVFIGSFNQDPTIGTIAAAREWFMTADATKIHQILLMIKPAAK